MKQQSAHALQTFFSPTMRIPHQLVFVGGLTLYSFNNDDKLLSKVTRLGAFGLTIPNCPATLGGD